MHVLLFTADVSSICVHIFHVIFSSYVYIYNSLFLCMRNKSMDTILSSVYRRIVKHTFYLVYLAVAASWKKNFNMRILAVFTAFISQCFPIKKFYILIIEPHTLIGAITIH